MSQWTNTFLAESSVNSNTKQALDPISFAFTRFALNVSLCYRDVNPSHFLRSKVHILLAALVGFDNELVSGPAILGLTHLSLIPEMKHEIVTIVGLLKTILELMVHSHSNPILLQCCKLIASLALHIPSKAIIINSGCIHGVLDLILGNHKNITRDIQYYSLCASVNITYSNDANRVLVVELKAIQPIITTIQTTSDDEVLLQAVKSLANIAFSNPYTSGCILSAGDDDDDDDDDEDNAAAAMKRLR
jgi:hypothetical protein